MPTQAILECEARAQTVKWTQCRPPSAYATHKMKLLRNGGITDPDVVVQEIHDAFTRCLELQHGLRPYAITRHRPYAVERHRERCGGEASSGCGGEGSSGCGGEASTRCGGEACSVLDIRLIGAGYVLVISCATTGVPSRMYRCLRPSNINFVPLRQNPALFRRTSRGISSHLHRVAAVLAHAHHGASSFPTGHSQS
jgi:hypothetical protein